MATAAHEPLPNFDNLIIREAQQADLPALEWDGEYIMFRKMYANLYQNTLSGSTLMWVVEEPKIGIIGQAFVLLKSVEPQAADGKNRAYVFSFRVKAPWRNQGIGGYLMDFIESDLLNRGFRLVTLNVAKENTDALRLYERLGYKVIGSRAGNWSFIDHEGNLQVVHEPSWRMMKRIG